MIDLEIRPNEFWASGIPAEMKMPVQTTSVYKWSQEFMQDSANREPLWKAQELEE